MLNEINQIHNFTIKQIESVLKLTEEGYTIPFIARYRKEQTHNLNEIDIKNILDEKVRIDKVNSRRDEIIAILTERNQLTPKLLTNLNNANKLSLLENIYKPYKKKQKTKAMLAREKGLEIVAEKMHYYKKRTEEDFNQFIGKHYKNQAEILDHAIHILIDDISSDNYLRGALKEIFYQRGKIIVRKLEISENKDPKQTYKNYYSFDKPLKYLESFQLLAINRGVKENILQSSLDIDSDIPYKIERILRIRDNLAYYPELVKACKKAYSLSIKPSLTRELMNELTEKAESRALEVFKSNLRGLFLKKPYRAKCVLGIDPGFRTGCKVALVDKVGNLLAHNIIYPTPPVQKLIETEKIIVTFVEKYQVDVIAIGDGTASYETSLIISQIIEKHKLPCKITIISESGASVYSASEIAQNEFPDLDLTLRSAISIARRVLSFLDELIKIPPESIGVGMYQHDINDKKLKESLEFEVSSIVHYVGVDLNSSSPYLLQYVSGISKRLAQNIVSYRQENGPFTSRQELLKVKGFGAKAFELASGFCRVSTSVNPLDNTIIHPDDYGKVIILLKHLSDYDDITKISYSQLKEIFRNIPQDIISLSNLTQQEVDFIHSAIVERHIDPRDSLPSVKLTNKIMTLENLEVGYQCEGEVKNVTDFGLFVSIGTKTDGLLHVSHFPSKQAMFKNYLPGKMILVEITSIDVARNRIQLKLSK